MASWSTRRPQDRALTAHIRMRYLWAMLCWSILMKDDDAEGHGWKHGSWVKRTSRLPFRLTLRSSLSLILRPGMVPITRTKTAGAA